MFRVSQIWKNRLPSRSHLKRNCSASLANRLPEEKYEVGEEVHGYTILQTEEIADYHAHATLLRHNKTGAQHLHIARDDQNNVFSVAFRTTPMDDTGVSHILEHTVLCGSAKYPCRDPFFKMLNRSLSTFMNAFTASDWTMYPFSTQNPRDYENLLNVYLDAAFYPNINEMDFRQEGWRLEHSNLNDVTSPIQFKGVVFNEMKGALSTGESIYHTAHHSLLLPDHTYAFNSGGDPLAIPKLSYEQLKRFYTSYYHPSNARFYTYGNLPLEAHLDTINENVLKNFTQIQSDTQVPIQNKWNQPREASITCPSDPLAADPEKQTTVSVSYMLQATDDPFETFVMSILSALLTSGPNSPFYQALVDINIGSDYSPATGLDNQIRHPVFSVGLQGLHNTDVDRVKSIIQETLQKVFKEGFESERIESILHNIEISQKHQSSNFGLTLVMGTISQWNHDKNPINYLFVNNQLKRFRETLAADPEYLQKKVKEYFTENTHKLTLVMSPDLEYSSKKEKQEGEMLKKMIDELSEENKLDLLKKGQELQSIQNKVEDVSYLPKMKVDEIERSLKTYKVENQMFNDVKVFTSKQPTNGIAYFKSIITTSSLPYIAKPYLPLFCNVLTRLGAGSRNDKELAQTIELATGGMQASTHLATNKDDNDGFEQGIMLSSHCLERNVPMMFNLWQDVLNEPKLHNPDRLRTLISAAASDMAQSVAQSGHLYAMATAAKSLSPSAQLAELFSGLQQVEFMKELVERDNLDEVIKNLMSVAMYMCNSNEMRCAINAPEEMMNSTMMSLSQLVESLNTAVFDDDQIITDDDFKVKHQKTFVEMDLPVNYVSRCIRGVPYTHPDHAKLQVLLKLLSAKFLHPEIREKGGAYGSGAKIDGGVISFFSYRDPNTIDTIRRFEKSAVWASEANFTADDIEEAKLSLFSQIDSPVPPSSRGMALFRNDLSDNVRQTHRDRLFAADHEQLVDVAKRYLLPDAQIDAWAIVGPANEPISSDKTWKRPVKLKY